MTLKVKPGSFIAFGIYFEVSGARKSKNYTLLMADKQFSK
jgi:hypothetical protein